MKNKILHLIVATAIVGIIITGCQQTMTKKFGGDMTLELEPNQKLEEITWKDDSLWYLTRPMRNDEKAETHIFMESSNTGFFEGTITVIESTEVTE